MKAFGFRPPPSVIPPMPVIPPIWELHLAWWLEMIGGTALVLGFLTRPVAFILSGERAVAYWQVHYPISPWLTAIGGMAAAVFSVLFLSLSFPSSGAWGVDAMLAPSKDSTVA